MLSGSLLNLEAPPGREKAGMVELVARICVRQLAPLSSCGFDVLLGILNRLFPY